MPAAWRAHRDRRLELAIEADLEHIGAVILRRLEAARIVGRELADQRRFRRIRVAAMEPHTTTDLPGADPLALDRHHLRSPGLGAPQHRRQPGGCHLARVGDHEATSEYPFAMLTSGDDYPIHQLPEPVAYAAGERNFYDRYFFNGYERDSSVFFAAALGVYPQLGVMDAAFSVIVDGVQRNLRASRASAAL